MNNKFEFMVAGRACEINDLGSPMNELFLKLHEAYFSNVAFDLKNFKEHSLKFFDANQDNYVVHDKFFNNFTIIWTRFLSLHLFDKAAQLWNLALNIAYEWENKGPDKRIHKGTPYYFLGVTCILNQELDKGFLLMHQALEEDKGTHNTSTPLTPAYFFVTLDYQKQNQFFRGKVLEIAKFIDKRLSLYRSSRNGSLNLADFKSRLLEETSLEEAIFYLVFTMFRLRKMILETDQRLTQNVFASLLHTNTIFDLCLIVDAIIKNKNPNQWKFFDHLRFLSSACSLSLNANRLAKLGNEFDSDFSSTLQRLLNSNYSFRDRSTLKPIEEDIAITYGFRNFGAHKIEDQPIIYQNFEQISQRILNTLFFSIEKLF